METESNENEETQAAQPDSEPAQAPKTDREEGGPTADESSDEEATGAGHGTREAPFDAHE